MLGAPDFLERLSSSDAVPGGGSVAALQAAMAAALLAMVANLTIGRKKYAAVESEAQGILDEALVARDRAVALADDDVRAFELVASALKLPRLTEEERARRTEAIQRGLVAAAGPPLETMACASGVVELAGRLVAIGNRSAISDVGTAALAARAAYHAARLNVEINLAGIRHPDAAANLRSTLDALPAPDPFVESVVSHVEAAIRSGAG